MSVELPLQSTSFEIWQQKYQLKDSTGEPVDNTIDDTYKRIAAALAAVEKPELQSLWYVKFLHILRNGATPAGRIISNAGAGQYKPSTSLINCTVSKKLSDDIRGIMSACHDSAITLASGAGIGYEFSTLRPKGAYVNGAGAYTSGPLPFMDIFNTMCFTISSAGGRRGAQMGTFAVWHPDVEEFIKAKREDGRLRQFNLSLLIDDAFIKAVKSDSDWELVFPLMHSEKVNNHDCETVWKELFWDQAYCEEQKYTVEGNKILCRVYKTIKAKDLWDTIMRSTYDYAEPGFLLIDKINKYNPNWFCENVRATNPCLIEGTLVQTPKGYIPVEDINEGDTISTVKGNGVVKTIEVHNNVDVFKVNMTDGSELLATAAHIFHSFDGSSKKINKDKRLDQLKVGDRVRVHKGELPNNAINKHTDALTDREYGMLIGAILGDGCYTEKAKVVKISCNRMTEQHWAEYLKSVFEKVGHSGIDNSTKSAISVRSTEFMKLLDKSDLKRGYSYEKNLPVSMLNSNAEFLKGYIDGYISTDGNIHMCVTNPMVRVSSASLENLQMLKRAMNLFGIHAKIYKGKKPKSFIDGREIIARHDKFVLCVLGSGIKTLAKEIILSNNNKQQRLEDLIDNYNLTGEMWTTTIKSVEYAGKAKVYDLYEPSSDTWLTEGIVNVGCGEQPLPPEGSCLLGSINLAKFVEFPFTDRATFNMEEYRKCVRVFTRMLDNVVELNGLPLEGQRREITTKRRHGMGFTGLGSMLSLLGIEYGSDESVKLTESLMREMAVEGFKQGIELACEKGCAPLLADTNNRQMWVDGEYMQRIWSEWPAGKAMALEHGCRFTHHTSIAPTGTISLSLNNNVSNGIEPSFSHKYTRNVIVPGKKSKEAVDVYSYEMLLYKHITGEVDVPKEFSTSDTVTTKQHVDIQAAAQYWCDSSISKTINVPTDLPFEEFKEVYMYAYDKGLKGCTTFRFNPAAFQGVLVKEDDLKKTMYTFILENGETVEVSGDTEIEYEGEMHSAANLYDAIKENYYGKF